MGASPRYVCLALWATRPFIFCFYYFSGVDLLKAVDQWKCQTLFLSQISQKALRRAIFPIGDITKDVVKQIARDEGLEKIAQKREVHVCVCVNFYNLLEKCVRISVIYSHRNTERAFFFHLWHEFWCS